MIIFLRCCHCLLAPKPQIQIKYVDLTRFSFNQYSWSKTEFFSFVNSINFLANFFNDRANHWSQSWYQWALGLVLNSMGRGNQGLHGLIKIHFTNFYDIKI